MASELQNVAKYLTPQLALGGRRGAPAPSGNSQSGLRIRIELPARKPKTEPKQLEIRVGAQTVQFPYYKTKWIRRKTRRVYAAYKFFYHDGLRRRQVKRSTLTALKAEAQKIAISKENGETARLQLTRADQASYLRARELLAPIGKPLELVVSEAVECAKMLNGRASIAEAVRDYLARHPAGVIARTIPNIVAEFFIKRTMSAKWRRMLKKMLERLAGHFTGSLQQLTARDLEDWLDGLKDAAGTKIGLRSRRNYRDAITGLINFAKSRGYLAKDWEILKDVSDPEPAVVAVNIYTPAELTHLLNTAESYESGKKLVPLIAITAFAGVRHGEMNEEKLHRLDWSNIKFKGRRIYVGKDASKTGFDRWVDMPANLVEWLKPYARPTGRICELKNTGAALCKLRARAARELVDQAGRSANTTHANTLRAIAEGLRGPKKNALRKSFITYQLALTRDIAAVADQAGNSAGVIRRNYKHIDEGDDDLKLAAVAWFAIAPTRADILPLFAWGKTA